MPEAKGPDPDQDWLKNVYRGGIRQLTPRAVVAGMLLGAVMCLSNLYVVLKTGWSLGVTVTACILGFALFRALRGVGLSRTPFTLLENSAVGSVAAAESEGGKARLLGWAGAIGAAVAWMRDAKAAWMPFNIRGNFPFPFSYGGHPAAHWTMAFDGSLILLGSGAIVGFRTGWSMLLGAVLTYGFLAPRMAADGVTATVSYKGIMQLALWPSSPSKSSASVTTTATPPPLPPTVSSKTGPRSSPIRSTLRSSPNASPSAANTSSWRKASARPVDRSLVSSRRHEPGGSPASSRIDEG